MAKPDIKLVELHEGNITLRYAEIDFGAGFIDTRPVIPVVGSSGTIYYSVKLDDRYLYQRDHLIYQAA